MNLKKMPFVALFLALLYCAFNPFIVSAKTGSVEGWVVDHSGAVIPDAKIIATFIFTNPFVPKDRIQVTNRKFSAVSNESGAFKLTKLPVGLYLFRATVSWSKITPTGFVQIHSGVTSKIELVLKPPRKACVKSGIGGAAAPSEKDRAEIVRQMLSIKFKRDSRLRGSIRPENKLVLSEKSIKRSWLGTALNSFFELMPQSEIQRRADRIRDFKYLVFSEISLKGDCVVITLDHVWAVGKNSNLIYLDGSGITYEFRKYDGKWTYVFVSRWIS